MTHMFFSKPIWKSLGTGSRVTENAVDQGLTEAVPLFRPFFDSEIHSLVDNEQALIAEFVTRKKRNR